MTASIGTVDYTNVLNTVQQNVYQILTNDSTVTTSSTYGTVNIMDGMPAMFWRNKGFPYILVRTPSIEEERITQTRFRATTRVPIEIYSRKESTVRQLADAVRTALYNYRHTTAATGKMCLYRVASGSMDHFFLNGDSSKPVWLYRMEVEYVA